MNLDNAADRVSQTKGLRRTLGRAEWIVGFTAVACFVNILPNDSCYDDNPVIRYNDKINAPGQWSAIWTTDYWSQTAAESPHRDLLYRPITLTVFRLTHAIAGDKAWAYHLLSVALHALVSVLVVRLARLAGLNATGALAAGLMFAVLPIHGEVVAGAVGGADLLATGGTILAILFHNRARGTAPQWSAMGFASAAAIAAFVAMGAKESGIASVPLVVLWDALADNRNRSTTERNRWWSLRTAARLSYLLLPLAAYVALRFYALGGTLHPSPAPTKTVNVLVDAPIWQHALGALQLWGMYWARTLYPKTLCIEYAINSVRLATSPIDVDVLLGVAVTIALLAGAVIAWRRGNRVIAFLVAALVVGYVPTSNAVVLIQVFFAERIWYLPSVFAVLLIGFAAGRLPGRPVWQVAGLVIVLAMSARCWVRNAEWRDNETLYAAAYRDHPNSVLALHLYGQWLVQHGDFEQGVELVRRALDIDVGFTDAHRTLGAAYLAHGRYADAIRHLQIAEMQVPGHPPTRVALEQAAAKRMTGGAAADLDRLQHAADAEADDIEAQLTLIRALRELGRTEEALGRLRGGESRFGDKTAWQAEYAVTLVYLDRRDEAIAHYRQALQPAPQSPQLLVELAMLLLERRAEGDLDDARQLAAQAEHLAPDDPVVLACRAEVQALRGDVSGAVQLYQRAIEALPPADPRRRMFEERAKVLGR